MNNEEFIVDRVFLTLDGLKYEGKISRQTTERLLPAVEHVKEIPGESLIGYFNFRTGMTENLSEEQIKTIEENKENSTIE